MTASPDRLVQRTGVALAAFAPSASTSAAAFKTLKISQRKEPFIVEALRAAERRKKGLNA